MGWLWRRLDAKQVGSSGATSRGSPELKPTGKRWGAAPLHFPALKTGGNFEAQQAPWWPSGTPQAGRLQKRFWLRLRAADCWCAAGRIPPAARAAPAGGFAPQMPRGLEIGTADRRTPSFLASFQISGKLAFAKHGSISRRIGQWMFVLRSALCLVSRPAALGFAACGTCLSPAPALVWL
jgi:hypothetical protein